MNDAAARTFVDESRLAALSSIRRTIATIERALLVGAVGADASTRARLRLGEAELRRLRAEARHIERDLDGASAGRAPSPPTTPQSRGFAKEASVPPQVQAEALIYMDRSGRYLDANEAAVALLGVTLEDLLTSSPDRFAFDPAAMDAEQEALRRQWDGTTALVGEGGLRRADGSPIRVSFAFEPTAAGFVLRLSRLDAPPEAPPVLLSVGDVLREWRAAERDLAELEPGTQDWARVIDQIGGLRERYQSLFAAAKVSG